MLQEHRSQAQAKAAVRLIRSKGNFAFAALLFSGISAISEGLQFQESFQELQKESFRKEFQKQSFQELSVSLASACEQDGMRADTSAYALGTHDSCDMSACAVGSARVCKGTIFSEMLSHLKGSLCATRAPKNSVAREGESLLSQGSAMESASDVRSVRQQRQELSRLREIKRTLSR